MKKFFSLLAAVLLAGSIMAADAITCAAAAEAAKGGSTATVTVRGYVTNIAFAWKDGSMSFWMADTKDGGKVFEAYKCECAQADAPVVGDLVEATGNLTMYQTTAELAAGCTVVIIEKTQGGGVPSDAITCAAAAEAAKGGSTDKVTVRGYVTNIAFAWKDGSMSFWMADTKDGGKVFEAYKCECAQADAPVVGDLVEATGNLTMYQTTAELAAGCTVVIIEKAQGGGGDVPAEIKTCVDAAAAALSVANNNDLYNNGAEYTIQGYVTEIAYEWAAGSMSFWMADAKDGGKVLEAYKCAIEKEEDAVRVGDLVKVTGKLTKFNKTPEFAAGCTVEIVERAEVVEAKNLGEKTIAEFLELKNTVDTCILTGVVDSIKNTTYGNLYLSDATAQVYVYGVLTPDGEKQKFEELGVRKGDTLTVLALYSEFQGAPQVKNAIFVSVKKRVIEPGEEIEVNMSEGLIFSSYVESEGWWQMYGEDEHFVISISNVETIEAEGTYTIDDLDGDYTYLGIINGTDTAFVAFVDGSVTLSKDAEKGTINVAGSLIGNDDNAYLLNLVFVEPKAEETVNVNIIDGQIEDAYADYGLYGLYGTDENDIFVMISVWAEEGLQGDFNEQDLDYESLGSGVMEGQDPAEIYKASITITPGNGEDYNVTADLLCFNNKLYKVTMYIPSTEGIEGVEATVNAIKSIVNGQLVIEKKGVRYNATGAVVR